MDLRLPWSTGWKPPAGSCSTPKLPAPDKPKIIALTTFNRDQAVVQAVQAGASGYLLKSAEPEFLLAAIRTVHSGYSVIAPRIHPFLLRTCRQQTLRLGPNLSVLDVLPHASGTSLLAAKGLSDGGVAESLFFSEATARPPAQRLDNN